MINDHSLSKNKEKLKFLIKNSNCGKSFMNFDSLRNHLKVCTSGERIKVNKKTRKIL